MIILIIGGSSSGKSAFAEKILSEITEVKTKYYLATMQVCDEDSRKKVAYHRELRYGKGFLTIEQPRNLVQAAKKIETTDSAVLLECMSNLTANEMFDGKRVLADEVVERILNGIELLQTKAKHLIIVTNNVFEDGILYKDGTMEYLKVLSEINRELAIKANKVVEVVVGIPVIVKESVIESEIY